MKNNYLAFLIIALAVAIIVPQITLAAWWNPFSWNWGWVNRIFHFQQTQQQEQKQAQNECKKENEQCGYSFGKPIGECCEGMECKLESNIPDAATKCKKPSQAVANETVGWKTYANTEYGFEFKYPKEWIISENNTGTTVSVWSSESRKNQSIGAIIPIYPELSVNYQNISSFKEFAKGLVGKDVSGAKDFVSSYGYFGSYTDANMGGQKGYAVISVANRAVYTLYFEYNGGVYVLGTEDFSEGKYDPKNPKIDANVKNIFSTFKFIP